jgi:hypothetical protein
MLELPARRCALTRWHQLDPTIPTLFFLPSNVLTLRLAISIDIRSSKQLDCNNGSYDGLSCHHLRTPLATSDWTTSLQ